MNQPAEAAIGCIQIQRTTERACRRPIFEAMQNGRRIAKLSYIDKEAMASEGIRPSESPHWAVLWGSGRIDRHESFREAKDNALKGY